MDKRTSIGIRSRTPGRISGISSSCRQACHIGDSSAISSVDIGRQRCLKAFRTWLLLELYNLLCQAYRFSVKMGFGWYRMLMFFMAAYYALLTNSESFAGSLRNAISQVAILVPGGLSFFAEFFGLAESLPCLDESSLVVIFHFDLPLFFEFYKLNITTLEPFFSKTHLFHLIQLFFDLFFGHVRDVLML